MSAQKYMFVLAALGYSLLAQFEIGGRSHAEGQETKQSRGVAISTLYLFVHPIGDWDADSVRREYTEKWRALLAAEGPKKDTAACFFTCGPESMAIAKLAQGLFGQRCIIDPSDDGPATRLLIASDLEARRHRRPAATMHRRSPAAPRYFPS